jgi:3-hydroxymyristoyl/3-hydroxydecanoyl-(acyl carrier protein) dehydratase
MKSNGEHHFSVHIEDNHPACDGHFEGNPILPGVVTLEYVRLAFKDRFPHRKIRMFSKVKFTHSLKPGKTLFINFVPEKPGTTLFNCFDCQEQQILVGTLLSD